MKVLMLDVDNCLYPVSTGIGPLVKDNIASWVSDKMGLVANKKEALAFVVRMYAKYGLTLKGLMVEHAKEMNPERFHEHVHGQIDIEAMLQPDALLRTWLLDIKARCVHIVCFSNADTPHVHRVLRALGINDIVDATWCVDDEIALCSDWVCKPHPLAFQHALDVANKLVEVKIEPKDVLFLDDAPHNIKGAKEFGFQAIFVKENEGEVNAPYEVKIEDYI